jgi:hypothetical protein
MKIKLLLFSATLFLLVHISAAQTPGYYFSSIQRPVKNKQDSLVLIHNEQKMWQAASKGSVMMFDNPMMDCEFKVRMSKAEVDYGFKDSIPTKSGSSLYMMNLMENRSADTFYLMSFSPFLTSRSQQRYWVDDSVQKISPDTNKYTTSFRIIERAGHWETGPWQTGISVRYLMPLSEYPVVLPAKEFTNANLVYRRQLASQLKGKLFGDTIYRTVYFTCDSNEYLPQAPYANLLATLKNYTLAGEMRAYKSNTLSEAMSKADIESTYVDWDSTNQVEDPNNPGVFILAPLKSEGRIKSLLICEKWVPYQKEFTTGMWLPQPYMGYRRIVTAYGLQLDSGNILWFSPAQMTSALLQGNFNMIPYEECFRAERFKTLQVQLRTW